MVETRDELPVLVYFSAKFRSVIEDEVQIAYSSVRFW